MIRDLDLLRTILLRAETSPLPLNLVDLAIEGYDFSEIAAHVELLVEAGLVDAELVHADAVSAPIFASIKRLRWPAHEFLDLARDQATWERVRDAVKAVTGAASFGVVEELLASQARVRLKLE
jgi:transcriptional antiterminator Rof (Rho-off)